jgi:outer membrane receptor protein involved in Fe transport
LSSAAALFAAAAPAWSQTTGAATAAPAPAEPVAEVVVTASTRNLLGIAVTSSQGTVTKQELELRPVYRVGQLLETVPGLIVTVHSGEGKANQYLLRGFNLDHGTDLATFVDEMPVNQRTHAHGQGYTDLNFFIPELASGVTFTKGPYYAGEGDFATVGADHISYIDSVPRQMSLSAGTLHDDRLFVAGTRDIGPDDRLLAATELVHLDGPWVHPDDFRKFNGVLRYSHGDAREGYAVTAMVYRGLFNSTTDQPERAITEGLISRFGSLDPSDGGQSLRASLSARYAHAQDNWRVAASAYLVRNEMTLWNDFTHFLVDPVNGDQHGQNDRRTILGGAASYTRNDKVVGLDSDTTIGVQTRYDDIYLDLQHTHQRTVLATLIADKVQEASVGLYGENTTHWTPWLRSIVGLRGDYFYADDRNIVGGASGDEGKGILEPKGSLVFGPWAKTEFYLSAGEGYHSNDVRQGTAANSPTTGLPELIRPPFIVRSIGEEIGVRTTLIPHLQLAATLFQIDFDSELTYDADVGQTDAGPPSRRQGVEITAQYRPFHWIEVSANVAFTHARYTRDDPAGPFIPDAPAAIGSLGLIVDNLGPWFGGAEFRYLGAHPLTPDDLERSKGDQEWNANIGYKLTPKLKLRLDVFNVFDSKDNAAEYYYADRISPSEPATGVNDLHIHPLEPRSARLTLSAMF